ncbi:hypothetical protein FNV43_RR21738 [Rhamnella rubrinervis]|uniref:BHLH domain-containing protein n=1 Tax=Rhamnella rubrinervis TaxID=2594499 RepID=A0A8K0GRW4_9ROSA|nr:hypothetical protein FNV43_RR21738 [Rhamnella rubrinervis]
MDRVKNDEPLIQTPPAPNPSSSAFRQQPLGPQLLSNRSQPNLSQSAEGEIKGCLAARKIQKADREKLRRDRQNEQFVELGNVLDPDRPKNDKATILADTIQLLKDLTSQVNKLKAEHIMLTEESRELAQEKNDLREEKSSLKSDIENLNTQYQHRCRTMFPWAAMDHSVVMAPPSYPYPVPMPMPPGSIPMHPQMQPYHFYGNQNPGVIPNPCSTFVPYLPPGIMVEQQSTQYLSPFVQPGSRSNASGEQDSRNKSSGQSKIEKNEDSNNITTDLELKTPGSASDQELTSEQGKSQNSSREDNSISDKSSSSRCSSSRSVQDSSSNSIVYGKEADD